MFTADDLRQSVRRLRQSPGYTTTAILTFAIAIGANSAIFSAVNTVLLRPLPVTAPDHLAVVWQTDKGGQAVFELTYRHLREWTSAGSTFTHAAVMGSHNWTAVLDERGEPSRIWFNGVSAGFFDVLGVTPLLGRTFRPEDDVPNAPAVAILSYATWVRRFGANPNLVGTTFVLDGEPVEIVGVMPRGLDFPRGAEFWMPVVPILTGGNPASSSVLDAVGVFYVIGRLRPGLDVAAMKREVNSIEAQLDAANPGRLKWGAATVAKPFLDHVFGPVRPALRILWAAVAVLLLIACANVSGLMLTRVSRRRQEHGIRLALGATHAAVARVWITEIAILAVAGGAIGLVVAYWIAHAIVVLAPDDLPRVSEISIDRTVAWFAFAAVLAAALLTVVVPLRFTRDADIVGTLEGERSTSSRHSMRARSTLLVIQIAFAVVLLVGAGLVLRSFVALSRVNLGFTPDRVLSLTVQPRGSAIPPNTWLRDFVARVRTLPGVQSAGAVMLRPLMLGPIGQGVTVLLEGQPDTRDLVDKNPVLNYQVATSGYFETLRIPLKAGRFFTERDVAEAPRVAVVSESTARRLWPGQDPIGKRVAMSSFTPGVRGRVWRTIVGVVSDVRYRGLDEVQLDIYDPAMQVGQPADTIVVRTWSDPLILAAEVRAVARELDPKSIVDGITTLDAVVGRAEAPWRLTMWMFVLFAAMAFGLAIMGLFSVVALDVAQRRREFAIRFALGASRRTVVTSVVARAALRVIAGLFVGFGAAFVASRAVRALLFGIAPDDGVTYASVLLAVTVAVAFAAYVPARRAAASEPRDLLRT